MSARLLLAAAALLAAMPAAAQLRPTIPGAAQTTPVDDDADADADAGLVPAPAPVPRSAAPADTGARVAGSAVGRAGRRQTRDTTAAGIRPLGRLATRIPNRVQSRLRTRLDDGYVPGAGTADPFAVAEEAARTAGRPR